MLSSKKTDIIKSIEFDDESNIIQIHHSEGQFQFHKDEIISISYPNENGVLNEHEINYIKSYLPWPWIGYLLIFGIFGGGVNLFIFLKTNMTPDSWRYLASFIIVACLSIPLVFVEKDLVERIKNKADNTLKEGQGKLGDFFAIIFWIGLIITVFIYNSLWIKLSIVLLPLIFTLVVLLFFIHLFNRWNIPFSYEKIATLYFKHKPKFLKLTLKEKTLKLKLTKKYTINSLHFLVNQANNMNVRNVRVLFNVIELSCLIIFVLFSLWAAIQLDIPYWWKNLNLPSPNLDFMSRSWRDYFNQNHNFIEIFFHGFVSNIIFGSFLIIICIYFVLQFIGILFCCLFLPFLLSYKIISKLNIKTEWFSVLSIIMFAISILLFGFNVFHSLFVKYGDTVQLLLMFASTFTAIVLLLKFRISFSQLIKNKENSVSREI
jgi:hypothetical protein